jgi:hypothetical protein
MKERVEAYESFMEKRMEAYESLLKCVLKQQNLYLCEDDVYNMMILDIDGLLYNTPFVYIDPCS